MQPGEEAVHGEIRKVEKPDFTAAGLPQPAKCNKRSARDWDNQVWDHDCVLVWLKPSSNRNFELLPIQAPGRIVSEAVANQTSSRVLASCFALTGGMWTNTVMQPVKHIYFRNCIVPHSMHYCRNVRCQMLCCCRVTFASG